MADREFHYIWEWLLRSSPDQLWPVVSDTNRFNRVTTKQALHVAGDNEAGILQVRTRIAAIPLDWDEYPFEWNRPYRFGVVRQFHTGPLKELRTLATLNPAPNGGTHLHYEVTASPRNFLGSIAIPIQIGQIYRSRFERAFRQADAHLQAPAAQPDPYRRRKTFVTGANAQRLAEISQQLIDDGYRADWIDRLGRFISTAEDDEVAHLRAYALADHWNAPRRAVLELCLAATRRSLLDLSWELLCPLCRGAKVTAEQLDQIEDEVHCSACNLNFKVNFDRAIEVTFRPHATIRPVEVMEYCVGGPQITPHIVAQQQLAPGETRIIEVMLDLGAHRVRARSNRAHAVPGHLDLRVSVDADEDPVTTIGLIAADNGWSSDQTTLNSQATLVFENRTAFPQAVVVERIAWNDQATTATDLSTVQRFRDWFAAETLRPDVRLGIANLAILFTDLRGSTQLYRAIGDAPAFGRVLEHFDILRESVGENAGALIKTIGDSIMAAFTEPAAGVQAALEILRRMAEFNQAQSDFPLQIKMGLHAGSAMAVTLNDRLDYFGTTVNIASRLEGQAQGDDLIVSDEIMQNAAVQRVLTESNAGTKAFTTQLRGFVDEEFRLCRIRLR